MRIKQHVQGRLIRINDLHLVRMLKGLEGKSVAPKLPPGFMPTAVPKDIVSELQHGAGRAIISFSTGAQHSWTRPDGKLSLCTAHLVKALTGAASRPGDTTVRLLATTHHGGLGLHMYRL